MVVCKLQFTPEASIFRYNKFASDRSTSSKVCRYLYTIGNKVGSLNFRIFLKVRKSLNLKLNCSQVGGLSF